jgi:hypothetical protein
MSENMSMSPINVQTSPEENPGEINENEFVFEYHILLETDYAIEKLTDSLNNQRWFEGIVLAASYYKLIALDKLQQHLKEKNIPFDATNYKRIGLKALIIFLYGLGVICKNEYNIMINFTSKRNKIADGDVNIITPEEGKNLINDGIYCLKSLKNYGVSEQIKP